MTEIVLIEKLSKEKEIKADKETPLIKQYNQIKGKYPDALMLFRVGDFYETFGKDAITTARILGITLTSRNNGGSKIELAGFPHHSLDTYLPKLVRSGQRVAICDQLEDPKSTKTIVKRGVTELVTPGVSLNDKVLEHHSNNFLAAVHFGKTSNGVAFLDISTGEFYLAEGNESHIEKLLGSFRPSEVIYQKQFHKRYEELISEKYYSYRLDDWVFTEEFAYELLIRHFGTKSLKGFGIDHYKSGIIAAGAALHYLAETHHDKIAHITSISRIEEEKFVWMDSFTIRNLELLFPLHEGGVSLMQVIDRTRSPLGSRLLKRWIALPLKDEKLINERLDAVDYLIKDRDMASVLADLIYQVGDLERFISRASALRINPREVLQVLNALDAIAEIKAVSENAKSSIVKRMGDQLNTCNYIRDRIRKEIKEDAPALLNKGAVISDGVDEELDQLRKIAYSGKDYLLQIQQRETERTGIPSLKISYNNVFGYYLEVRNTHKDKVPADWIRKQTLTQAERYITEELKQYEEKILGAEEKMAAIEDRLFNELVQSLADYIKPLQHNASVCARLDVLQSFANHAVEHNYIKPKVDTSLKIDIKAGRHPVIEKQLPVGEEYIANDIFLDTGSQQIIMITGPNMSGKSAILRQTALIVVLAQIGAYVPAEAAHIGLVDKIFTRVGASDNISSGESTFMVEMNETASILNNLSERSLILLDEIGRGTSTYDGISIAWATAEYLHENPKIKAKTLFATHYHELNEMASAFKRIKNFNVSVKETSGKIIFMRKLVPGGSEHSFGIHVAQMAGMPQKVVNRAKEILTTLEKSKRTEEMQHKTKQLVENSSMQLSFFQLDDPILVQIRDEISSIDINTLTPVEALMKLSEIKKLTGVKK
ncbi:MAG: DNA mismatch repair protein MutS [Flavobacteriales bacterium]